MYSTTIHNLTKKGCQLRQQQNFWGRPVSMKLLLLVKSIFSRRSLIISNTDYIHALA
jgi:hypothetical protein